MRDPLKLRLAVGYADAAGLTGFHSSMAYWHTGLSKSDRYQVHAFSNLASPLALQERSLVEISGDCVADLSVPEGSLVHVYGDLRASLSATNHCEIVIAGDLATGGAILADGIVHVFVGGNLLGSLRSRGMCLAWVRGDCRGEVLTGEPSMHLHVLGDCLGSIRPAGRPALLTLGVGKLAVALSMCATPGLLIQAQPAYPAFAQTQRYFPPRSGHSRLQPLATRS